jgi:copper chaperone CopZ
MSQMSRANTITSTLQPVDGGRSVSAVVPARQVRVDYDEQHVSVEKMKELLQEEDHPVASIT